MTEKLLPSIRFDWQRFCGDVVAQLDNSADPVEARRVCLRRTGVTVSSFHRLLSKMSCEKIETIYSVADYLGLRVEDYLIRT